MRWIIIVWIALFFASCKKAEERTCFKSSGPVKELTVSLIQGIDSLHLYDDLVYTIIPSATPKIVLKGGGNLLQSIRIDQADGKLIVQNENKCNFLRDQKRKIAVDLYLEGVSYIEYEGSASLKTKDTLYSNELRFFMREGAGKVDLTVENGYTSFVIANGYGDFKLKGKSLMAFLHCNEASFGDARNFVVQEWLKVLSNTVGEMKVNADQSDFSVELLKSGNVGYVGAPHSIQTKISGKGKIIDLN